MKEGPRRFSLPATVALLLFLALCFRLAVVHSWHVPAGDGLQYHALSQELRLHGRFAFGPPPRPLSYTRMPGYPLFLAYVAVRQAPADLQTHLVRATRANVLLDMGTALLVFLILRQHLRGRRWTHAAALCGLCLSLSCPLLILLSCYGLSESLATFLSTLEVYLALHALGDRPERLLLWAALSGLVAGLGLLVRADAVALLPAVLLCLLWSPAPRRRRLLALGVGVLTATLVFMPWPVRNLMRFGHPYFASWFIRTMDGRPLPLELVAWESTWGSGKEGESYLDLPFVIGFPLDVRRPSIVQPAMYDDPEERARVVALFQRYNREGTSQAVSEGFAQLAHDRSRRHPFRTHVLLPLRRMAKLWSPVPEYELPMRTPLLGLPRLRPLFGVWDALLFGCALLGAVALWRAGPRQRRLVIILGTCVVVRTLLCGYLVPLGLTERHLMEVFPLLLVLGGAGIAVLGSLLSALAPRGPSLRRVPQEQTQEPPAVPEGAQVRRPAAGIPV